MQLHKPTEQQQIEHKEKNKLTIPVGPYHSLYLVLQVLKSSLNPHQTGVSESLIRGGGGKWPTGENRLYRPHFCILNIKNHIKGLQGHKSCPKQGP